MQDILKLAAGFCFAAFLLAYNVAQAGIYDFKGGVRVPAGSCLTYLDQPNSNVVSVNGGLRVSNSTGSVGARCVCQLPVPEKAKIRQFVMVGNVSKGEIFAYIGSVPWNQPRQ